MQERRVNRVDADLERLQPVAIDHTLERERVAVRGNEAVEMRKCRRLAGPEIGKEDSAFLNHRVRFLFDVCAKIAVVRLGRRLETFAVHVEQPPVKGAAQAAVFKSAISEVSAAMRTTAADQAIAPA